jgi:hypothetical protein
MLSKIQNTLYQLTPEDKFFLLLSGLGRTHPIHPSFVVDTNDFIYGNHLYNVLRGPSCASPPYLLMDFCGSAGCFAPKISARNVARWKDTYVTRIMDKDHIHWLWTSQEFSVPIFGKLLPSVNFSPCFLCLIGDKCDDSNQLWVGWENALSYLPQRANPKFNLP